MEFVGSYIINGENLKEPPILGGQHHVIQPVGILLLRDRALQRGKKLYAKILNLSIDDTSYIPGRMIIREYAKKDKLEAKVLDWEITFDRAAALSDLAKYLNDSIKYLKGIEKEHNNNTDVLKNTYEFQTYKNKLCLKITYNSIEVVEIETSNNVAEFFGWNDSNIHEFIKGNTFYEPPSYPLHTLSMNNVYFSHPDFINSNFNLTNITGVGTLYENGINQEQRFEIQSMSPYCPVRFWVIDRGVHRNYYPANVNIVFGFYEL